MKDNKILILTHSHENSQMIKPFEKTMNFPALFSRVFSENIFQYFYNENSLRLYDIDVSLKLKNKLNKVNKNFLVIERIEHYK